MNFHLILTQNTKSPYYLGFDKLASLWKVSENTLRNIDKSFRSGWVNIDDARRGTTEGFIIECDDVRLLSVVFGEIAKMISIDPTAKFPVEIHPEGLTGTYAKFLG